MHPFYHWTTVHNLWCARPCSIIIPVSKSKELYHHLWIMSNRVTWSNNGQEPCLDFDNIRCRSGLWRYAYCIRYSAISTTLYIITSIWSNSFDLTCKFIDNASSWLRHPCFLSSSLVCDWIKWVLQIKRQILRCLAGMAGPCGTPCQPRDQFDTKEKIKRLK